MIEYTVAVQLTATARTHRGRRRNNEDAFVMEAPLFIVSDGMGDHGAEASEIVIRSMVETFSDAKRDPVLLFEQAVATAAAAIDANEFGKQSAATMAALFVEDSGITLAHVGDSRVYRLRRRKLQRLTRDHSVISDFEITTGTHIPDRSTHPLGTVVTRGLGSGGDARPDVRFLDLARRDRFLLCTDGLTDAIPETALQPLLARRTTDEAADALLAAAIENDATDNVTLLVVDAQ